MQEGDAAWRKRRRKKEHAEKRRVFREKLKGKKKKILLAAVLGAAAGVLVQSLWETIPHKADQSEDKDIGTLMPITEKEREDAANACAKYLAALQREEKAKDAMTYSPLMSLDPGSCQRTILEYRIESDREDLAGSYAAQTLGTDEYEELAEILNEDADSTEDLQALGTSAGTEQGEEEETEEEIRGKQARYIYELVTFGGDDGHSAYTIEKNGTEQETELFPEDDPAYEGYEEGAWTDGRETEETWNTEAWNEETGETTDDITDLPESYGTFAEDGSGQKTRIGDTWTASMYVVIRAASRSQCDAMEEVVERAILVHTKDLILSGEKVELHLVSRKETGSADENLAHLQEAKTKAWQDAVQERESIEENDLQVLSWREQKLFHKLLKEEQTKAETAASQKAAEAGSGQGTEESPWTWVFLDQNSAVEKAGTENPSTQAEGNRSADGEVNENTGEGGNAGADENEKKNQSPLLMAVFFQISWNRIQAAGLGALLAVLVYLGILWLKVSHQPLVWCREDVEAITNVRILGSILTEEDAKGRESRKTSEVKGTEEQNASGNPEGDDREEKKVPRETGVTAIRIKGACEDLHLKNLFLVTEKEDTAVNRLQEVLLALHIHLLTGNPKESPGQYEVFQKSDAAIVSCTAARTTRQTLLENINLCREEGQHLLGIVIEERPVPPKKKRKTLAQRRLEHRQRRVEARDRRKKARERRREERRRRRQLRSRKTPLRNQKTENAAEPFKEVPLEREPAASGSSNGSGITLEDLPEWEEESEESITPEEIAVIRRVLAKQEQELMDRRRRAQMVREKQAAKAGTPAARKEDMTAKTKAASTTAKPSKGASAGTTAAAKKKAAERKAV